MNTFLKVNSLISSIIILVILKEYSNIKHLTYLFSKESSKYSKVDVIEIICLI